MKVLAKSVCKHFRSQETVEQLLGEILARHRLSTEALYAQMVRATQAYYKEQYPDPTNRPSRFRNVDSRYVHPRLIVPLSGGIDSTVALYVAVSALGVDNVLPITMPARVNDPSVALARVVRSSLGYPTLEENASSTFPLPLEIDITQQVESYAEQLARYEAPLALGSQGEERKKEQLVRLGNFASRIRAAITFDHVRAIWGRVVGTCNRPEFCQGYGTKYGTPEAFDFGLLANLYKVEIYALADYLRVPQQVIDEPPSTGFFPGQTHAGELGASLEEQDIAAYLLFERNMSVEVAAERYGISTQFLQLMHQRFQISDHKRRIIESQDLFQVVG